MKHQNPEHGSLVTPCTHCGLEFSLQITHQGWTGIPCRMTPYNRFELTQFGLAYNRHWANRPVDTPSPAWCN